MHCLLARIENWESLALACRYSVSELARKRKVSVREFERFALEKFGRPPHEWLHALRMKRALELLRDGSLVKETKDELGYKTRAHLSHDFKQYFGVPPSRCGSEPLAPRQSC
jgi:AraC-like DNA-binding protein